jgi:hypothetical protein
VVTDWSFARLVCFCFCWLSFSGFLCLNVCYDFLLSSHSFFLFMTTTKRNDNGSRPGDTLLFFSSHLIYLSQLGREGGWHSDFVGSCC